MNLRRKIALSLCIVVALLLFIMCVSIYSKSAQILDENATNFATVQILRAQEKIDLMVEQIKLETINYSRDPILNEFFQNNISDSEVNQYLTKAMTAMNEKNGYYKDLFIVNLEGVIIASTMPNAMNIDLSQRNYIQLGLKEAEVQMSDILLALTDQANIVNSVYPILSPNGEIMGAFGIAVKAEDFTAFANNYNIGKSGYFAIIDSNGNILSHKDTTLIHKPATILNIPKNPENPNNDNDIDQSFDDTAMYTYKKMASNHWILLASLPKSELQIQTLDLLKYILLYGGGIIVTAILICLFLSNKISSPITSITNYIEEAQNVDAFYDQLLSTESHKYKLGFFDKDAIELIRKSQELNKSLEMKTYLTTRFMSVLSHDIRSSLTLIKGYAKGLLTGIINNPETQNQFIEEIYASANTLEQIAYDVLDSTYEVQTDQKIKKESHDLKSLTQELFTFAKKIIEANDRIFMGTMDITQGVLLIDKVKIIRAWQNMINNAVKYSDLYSQIHVTITEENHQILFAVKDEGMGIKENDKQYIFDMFYKSNLSEKNSYGLGLFISKSILEAHDSTIQFESTLNKGSTFWFYLPKTI